MRTVSAAMLALTLMTGSALSQTAQPPPPDPTTERQAQAPMPPPPGDRDGEDQPDGAMRGHHHRPPPPSKAARFRIEAGDVSIGMKCPDDEPLKDCADFTLQLLDKLSGLTRH